MRAEEVETIEEPQNHWDPTIEEHGYDDGSVVEIDGSQDIAPIRQQLIWIRRSMRIRGLFINIRISRQVILLRL